MGVKLSQETTIIAPEKLQEYILNPSNRDGESKARFLHQIGYERKNWETLERDLRNQHLSQETISGNKPIYGEKHEILAPLVGPNGKIRWVRSIWMVRQRETSARFITLIPDKEP